MLRSLIGKPAANASKSISPLINGDKRGCSWTANTGPMGVLKMAAMKITIVPEKPQS
jgi:hypothetical protein